MRLRITRLLLPAFAWASLTGCVTTNKKISEPFASQTPAEMDAPQKLELPPKENAKACLATAEMLDKAGKAPESIALYEKARSMDPDKKRVCRRLAVLYDRQGEFAKADEEYQKALALFPRDPSLLNDAGYSHYQRGNWTLAEDHLRKPWRSNLISNAHGTTWG